MTYKATIENAIRNMPKGSVFTLSDLGNLSDEETLKKTVQRLAQKGFIKRVMRGVYVYPKYSELLQQNVGASPNKVAEAIARSYGWTVAPCGDTALNLLGLSTQVVAVWLYLSNGPYKQYSFDNVKIHFKHTTNREISNLSYKTVLVVQAFKAIGKNNIKEIESAIDILRSKFSSPDKELILKESKYVSNWIYSAIKKIYEAKYE
ncbi:MAG: DUF6088 family protein [Spirochaetaceae bacterium]|nr:DUF6088 family protein [Spirochaetaceae bacterium]